MRMRKFGYARVSTDQQDTRLQRDALKRAGVVRIVEEKGSGSRARPALEALLEGMRAGDVLVVYKMDRLARSLQDLLRIFSVLEVRKCAFVSLSEPVETETALGRLMVQLLGAFAEFERSLIRERCAAGRRAARERGVKFGRPPLLGEAAAVMLRSGVSQSEVARLSGCHPSSANRFASRLATGQRFS